MAKLDITQVVKRCESCFGLKFTGTYDYTAKVDEKYQIKISMDITERIECILEKRVGNTDNYRWIQFELLESEYDVIRKVEYYLEIIAIADNALSLIKEDLILKLIERDKTKKKTPKQFTYKLTVENSSKKTTHFRLYN